MAETFRVFVSKRPGFDSAAEKLLRDLRHHLDILSLSKLRVFNRYEIRGIARSDLEMAIPIILSEPPLDDVFLDEIPVTGQERLLGVEYLPGQYDQRSDSTAQCFQILMRGERPEVATARFYRFSGTISDNEFQRIRKYMINPVDSREAQLHVSGLDSTLPQPDRDVPVLSELLCLEDGAAGDWIRDMALSLSVADLILIRDHFRDIGRAPTLTELRMLDTYWSDHCRHTTFHTILDSVKIDPGPYSRVLLDAYNRFLSDFALIKPDRHRHTLMDMATLSMRIMKKQGRLDDMEVSGEVNACSIIRSVRENGTERDWLILFKNETHNHPTEIEPFGGAATCLGGAIRDPLSGRAYVYQAMRVTGCGDPRTPIGETLPGKLPQRRITTEAAHGYSSYGNQIGLATGLVREIYHPGYVAKRMEVGAVIGAVPREHVLRRDAVPGDRILLVGGKTGRDGIGGATGSSKTHTEQSLTTAGAEVQKGNPPEERKLQRLFRNPRAIGMIRKCNDFGAGGVAVAVGELAAGIDVFLHRVPLKYQGLNATEVALSESQERMAVVVSAADTDAFVKAAESENLEATEIAVVTENNRLRMFWHDRIILNLERDFLDSHGAKQHARVRVTPPAINGKSDLLVPLVNADKGEKTAWLKLMADLNITSQQGLVEHFDASIGAASVHYPLGGAFQDTPADAMVAKIPLDHGQAATATAMTFGFDPHLSVRSPFHGAVYAVVEAVTRLAAVGVALCEIRFSLQEYFEKLGDDEARWGKPFSALLGAHTALMQLGVAAIGGKDSMSGSFNELDVPPTLIAFAVGTLDVEKAVSAEFKQANRRVYLVPLDTVSGDMPDFQRLRSRLDAVCRAIQAGEVTAARAIGMGGTAEGLAKMAFGNRIGLEIRPEIAADLLFRPAYGAMILEVPADRETGWLREAGAQWIADTIKEEEIRHNAIVIPLEELLYPWKQTLEGVFPSRSCPAENLFKEIPLHAARTRRSACAKTAHPRAFVPVFPGTNCEYDTTAALEQAGALARAQVFRNRSPQEVEESITALCREIDQAQMLVLPGGFSAGDEPEGSGKFIATVFRNPRVHEAVERLLNQRDGLILGICNGFQALIKLGLLPYGKILDLSAQSPTITYNQIGRHVARMVRTRIVSTLSPWFSRCRAGDIHTVPVSHGEGRFIASAKQLHALTQAGQVATQYVDMEGKPTMNYPHNPNGSSLAVEGICSPDGRILGKMGHSERLGPWTARNIPGITEPALFSGGVAYFR
ncbi:MAG TPA: phosphoribosylformylglycinamidine synthase [Candidatus Aminicenantes bacterium]|nr:phosphoribosylformylglycinamidine synthase [Candidatus Aminicenantes bacterium]